jgi:hypothetical protein
MSNMWGMVASRVQRMMPRIVVRECAPGTTAGRPKSAGGARRPPADGQRDRLHSGLPDLIIGPRPQVPDPGAGNDAAVRRPLLQHVEDLDPAREIGCMHRAGACVSPLSERPSSEPGGPVSERSQRPAALVWNCSMVWGDGPHREAQCSVAR